MPTVTQSVDVIDGHLDALEEAIVAAGNATYASLMDNVARALDPVLADPSAPITQETADTVGTALRELKHALDANLEVDLAQLEENLHTAVSQACVDHHGDIDWYQAAAVPRPQNGMITPQAGVKHKPEAQ